MGQYLTFELERRWYGVRVEHVNSVLDPQAVTPLPGASTIVTGLTNVRGNVVPVFDPRKALAETRVTDAPEAGGDSDGATSADSGTDERGIVIFEVENGTLLPFIGLQADRIGKVIGLGDGDIAPVPDFLPEDAARFFEGLSFSGGNRLAIIDLGELASRETLFRAERPRRA